MICFYSLFISLTPWVEKDGLANLDISGNPEDAQVDRYPDF